VTSKRDGVGEETRLQCDCYIFQVMHRPNAIPMTKNGEDRMDLLLASMPRIGRMSGGRGVSPYSRRSVVNDDAARPLMSGHCRWTEDQPSSAAGDLLAHLVDPLGEHLRPEWKPE
jgi:hypothetical protein